MLMILRIQMHTGMLLLAMHVFHFLMILHGIYFESEIHKYSILCEITSTVHLYFVCFNPWNSQFK